MVELQMQITTLFKNEEELKRACSERDTKVVILQNSDPIGIFDPRVSSEIFWIAKSPFRRSRK